MGWITRTLSSSIGKKMLMAASGSFLGLFILIHLIGNSTSLLGRATFLAYASHLHSLGILIPVFEILLLTVFCTHVFLAAFLFFENRQARPDRYAIVAGRGGKTFASQTMIYSGLVILIFVGVHLLNFHFVSHEQSIADIVRSTLSKPAFTVFYIVGMLALGLHISHGFWSLFQSLGIEHPQYTHTLDKKAAKLGLAVGLLFALIPVLALFFPGFLL
jgi:succinate dehydrogenase / fumarate reductase, cytochrome b subunit